MNVLVLGGRGFVGQHVMSLLQDSFHNVTTLSRRDGLDMTEVSSVHKHLSQQKPDVIINCAAHGGSVHYISTYAADVIGDNLQIILNLYRVAKEICPQAKIINPISNCSYPGDANIQIESQYWNGPVHKSVWSYGNSRRMIAVISECYSMQYGIKTVNFLVANCYGPGDYTDPNKTHALNGMIIRMLQAKQKRAPGFEIWGTGKPKREWVYVKDLARMLVDAINIENQLAPINLAQNKAYSIAETAEVIKESIRYEGKLFYNTDYQDGAPRKQLDDTLFRSKFPSFRFTDIETGIQETVAYYENVLGVK
jgi:GDP-L-fucose synthase